MFEKIKERISEELDLISERDSNKIAKNHPGLPREYLLFLREVGFGDTGFLQFYSGPVSYTDVYPPSTDLEHLLLFVDDQQGYCYAFDPSKEFKVFEISSRGELETSESWTFPSFVDEFFQEEEFDYNV